MTRDYFSQSPPAYELSASWMDEEPKKASPVFGLDELYLAVLATLKLKRKIQNAKHNIVGYRVEQKTAKGTKLVQDFD
ncbi:hypothetical protein HF086_001937 [Spodoptera exigua]|uniref:Uncharacterized protein n=1 Tax=Spodoptera exigua TaxID=7107 RepID=A0A922SF07_SPOEX|nr:hypothetical protein HF086_001937 [Spodoptera exigua]